MPQRDDASLAFRWSRILGALGIIVAALAVYPSLVWLDRPLPLSSSASQDKRISHFITGYAKHYGLDPALLRAVIKVESNFNPTAVSSKGARGLMQLMPPTAAALNVVDPFDPDENIQAGARELRRLLNRFNGNVALALAAYHAGETRVGPHISVPPFRSTERYVGKVLWYYHMFMDGEKEYAVKRFPLPAP
ncbi:MAG TPA: lytic transglycosylase domain-containing protein [Nitrospiraceae bacterium]|nr:lytic transglycosylase domain-containing protein [Nitrospiraceae bacterium]